MTVKEIKSALMKARPVEGLLEEYEQKRLKNVKKAKELIALADDPREQLVLQLRYLEGKTWETIGREIYYSHPTALRLHNHALEEIARRYGND